MISLRFCLFSSWSYSRCCIACLANKIQQLRLLICLHITASTTLFTCCFMSTYFLRPNYKCILITCLLNQFVMSSFMTYNLYIHTTCSTYKTLVFIRSGCFKDSSSWRITDGIYWLELHYQIKQLLNTLSVIGKQIIHPGQIPIVQDSFSPSPELTEWARGLITAFHQHEESGKVRNYI